ncbi:helix-turn-helix transcriptional regulator [Nonomuraea sp. NPDC049646]|uniref:helix-turn-helix transcriptional regulator n=1 Tax=unclassified Nonomuraea TaxID=2593643 RepID=UPI0037982053
MKSHIGLVGRGAELERLLAAVVHPPALAVVEGEAGIGKTRLVSELAARAGRPVFLGRCAHIREPFPLGPLLDAVRGIGAGAGTGLGANGPLSPVTGALRPLLPELAGQLPPAPEPLEERAAERHRIFRALSELLGSLGEVVLVLEDLHWADEQTLAFLGYLMGEPPPGLSVVLTFRGEEVALDARTIAARAAPSVSRAQVALEPLDVAETRELMTAILGSEGVSEEFAAHLCERTSGLPFAIQEMVALLRERGTLIRRGRGWARKAIDELNVPTALRDSVLERVGRLPAGARAVVEAAAVLQVPVPVAVLVTICGLARADALAGLEEALRSGLLSEHTALPRGAPDGSARAAGVGFRHMLALQAVYESIALPRRQVLHGRAAEAVERLRPVPIGQIAHHLRHAGMMEEWARAADRAAAEAGRHGDDSEAARLLGDVLREAPPEGELLEDMAVRFGWASVQGLHAQPGFGQMDDLLRRDLAPGVRGELHFLYGLLLERAGAAPELRREQFATAVRHLDDRPELAAWAMVGLGVPTSAGVSPAEHVYWLDRALETAERLGGSPSLQLSVLGKVAMVLTTIGDPRWTALTERMTRLAGGRPESRQEVVAFWSVGDESCYAGHYAVSERLLDAALRGGLKIDSSRRLEYLIRSSLAVLRYFRGEWTGLADETALLLDALDEQPHQRVTAELVAHCLAVARGEIEEGARRLRAAVGRAVEVGAVDALPPAVETLLRLGTVRGEPPDEELIGMLAGWRAKGLQPLAVRALPALAGALVAAGRTAEAGRLCAELERELDGLDAPLAPAALAHAQGFVTGDPERFLAGAHAYDELGGRYEAAQCRALAATALLDGDHDDTGGHDDGDGSGDGDGSDPGRAGALLGAAIAVFEELGARWDLDRAASTARRHGVAGPVRYRGGTRGYGDALSPREAEVAELAATGLSNREIAKKLFLSPKTVDKHLSAVLRKLGLRSRAGLGQRMGGSG